MVPRWDRDVIEAVAMQTEASIATERTRAHLAPRSDQASTRLRRMCWK
jgi:hypothetical protein